MLIGQSRVGKTSLLRSLKGETLYINAQQVPGQFVTIRSVNETSSIVGAKNLD
jgi:GTPase SAR1 family protein